MSSSTSSSEPHWREVVRWLVGTSLCVLGLLFVLVVVVDPHDHIVFSPDWQRALVNTNQRFSYPVVARNADFDSAVFGTSTARLLKPIDLEQSFGGSFANFSMNSATAHEQSQLLALFLRHHPEISTIVFGLDIVWCSEDSQPKYTFRPFPEWMYDDNPWNDLLYLLNAETVEQVGRQIEYWLGQRSQRYGPNGYKSFLPAVEDYDLEKARRKIYGTKGRRPKPIPTESAPTPEEWSFPNHVLLREMLSSIPEDATKVLLFVPYHDFIQPHPTSISGRMWRSCKEDVTRIASSIPNTHVLDFMISSPITSEDGNYWDSLHYSEVIAALIPRLMAEGISRKVDSEVYRYLATQRVE